MGDQLSPTQVFNQSNLGRMEQTGILFFFFFLWWALSINLLKSLITQNWIGALTQFKCNVNPWKRTFPSHGEGARPSDFKVPIVTTHSSKCKECPRQKNPQFNPLQIQTSSLGNWHLWGYDYEFTQCILWGLLGCIFIIGVGKSGKVYFFKYKSCNTNLPHQI